MSTCASYPDWRDDESGVYAEVWTDYAVREDIVFASFEGLRFTAYSDGTLEVSLPRSTAEKLGLVPPRKPETDKALDVGPGHVRRCPHCYEFVSSLTVHEQYCSATDGLPDLGDGDD